MCYVYNNVVPVDVVKYYLRTPNVKKYYIAKVLIYKAVEVRFLCKFTNNTTLNSAIYFHRVTLTWKCAKGRNYDAFKSKFT